MATARLTVGVVLDTVAKAAATLTSTLDTMTDAVGMVNAFVNKAAEEQSIRYKGERGVFVAHLIDEMAQEETMLMIRTESFIATSANHAKHYETAFNKYTTLLS